MGLYEAGGGGLIQPPNRHTAHHIPTFLSWYKLSIVTVVSENPGWLPEVGTAPGCYCTQVRGDMKRAGALPLCGTLQAPV